MGVFQSLWQVTEALAGLAVSLAGAILPWLPLLLWMAFWLFAVDWRKLYPVLAQGGRWGVILIGLMAILVWSVIADPETGGHLLFGLQVSNLVGKTVYVTGLLVIAALCGTVQLSGGCGRLCRFEEPATAIEPPSHHH